MSNPMNIFMNVEKSLSRLQANDIRLQLKFVPHGLRLSGTVRKDREAAEKAAAEAAAAADKK